MKLKIFRLVLGIVSMLWNLPSIAFAESAAESSMLWLDNGTLRVGIDREKGGSIAWLSWKENPKNAVNVHDPGRLIQQSYYAGASLDRQAEKQSPAWSPWPWNPIQGGGVGSWAKVKQWKAIDASTIYTETIPKLWDMPDETAAALMMQWTSLHPDYANVLSVRCEFLDQRDAAQRWGEPKLRSQEIPATYFTRNFSQFASYLGQQVWRNEDVPRGPPWGRISPPRNVIACFTNQGHGIAIFSPQATKHWNVGLHGVGTTDDAEAAPCVHMAPLDEAALAPQGKYSYQYWLIVGSRSQIQSSVDALLKLPKLKHQPTK